MWNLEIFMEMSELNILMENKNRGEKVVFRFEEIRSIQVVRLYHGIDSIES